jgi:ribonuclease Z
MKITLPRGLIYTLLALGLAAGVAWAFRASLSVWVAQKVVSHRLASELKNELIDGLHVGLCGAGSPFPDEKRTGPCTLVVAGSKLLVFDAGNAATRNLGKMGVTHGQINAIFLTHFHSDHLDGLGELLLQRWISTGNAKPVPVYGPPGVQRVVAGLREVYAQDESYRVAHHGEAIVPSSGFGGEARPFEVDGQRDLVVYQEDGVEVRAFAVDHAPVHPAVGYRISYKGRTVVLSGDTRASDAVRLQAKGVDVLVHEALSEPLVRAIGDAALQAGRPNVKQLMSDIVDYHTSPAQAAQVAQDAQVGYLMLSHIAPPLPIPGMEKAFLGDADSIYKGPIRVGIDGDFISLPADSKEIRVSKRF